MFSFNKRRTIRSNHSPEEALIAVFEEVRLFLARPENDFSPSRWKNTAVAVAEINGVIHQLKSGHQPEALQLELLFSPTGPMQDVSLQSGWEDAFFQLADRFDQAIVEYKLHTMTPRSIWQDALVPA